MTTVEITTEQTSDSTHAVLSVGLVPTTHAGRADRRTVPLFVPRSQVYYWSAAWQQDEAEALRDIAAGDVRRFASGADAAAWLLSDED